MTYAQIAVLRLYGTVHKPYIDKAGVIVKARNDIHWMFQIRFFHVIGGKYFCF